MLHLFNWQTQRLSYDFLMLPLENHIPQTDNRSKIARSFLL